MGGKHLQFVLGLLVFTSVSHTYAQSDIFSVSPILVSCETVGEGDTIPGEAFKGEDTAAWLDELVRRRVLDAASANKNRAPEEAARLVRSNTPATEALEDLKPFCNDGGGGVLFHHLRVKVGVPRGWKYEGVPFFGGNLKPIVNQSTARYRAVVRSCHTGEVRWRGEFQIRDVPTRGHEGLLEKLNEVYESFEWEKNDHY